MSHPLRGGAVGPGPVPTDPPEHRQPRRIVQITCKDTHLFALCNDGTIWEYGFMVCAWLPLPGIPQRQVAEGEL